MDIREKAADNGDKLIKVSCGERHEWWIKPKKKCFIL